MSTATLNSLRDYLTGTLSTNDMMWLVTELKEFVRQGNALQPYTMEELNERIAQSERESAAGMGQTCDEMLRELEEEFACEEQLSEAV